MAASTHDEFDDIPDPFAGKQVDWDQLLGPPSPCFDDDAPYVSPLWPREEGPQDPDGDGCRSGPVLAAGCS